MAVEDERSLSRAVSSVDLEAALIASQKPPSSANAPHDEPLTLRPRAQRTPDIPALDGVVSPRYPGPPPTTPADPSGERVNARPSNVAPDPSEDDFEHEARPDDVPKDSDALENDEDEGKKKKKKKKKKSSGKNKKAKPTGFEEFYADPPLTPVEFTEESQLYRQEFEFHQRIESCIQRYRARRNLDSARNNILTKYLMLGGIESTAKLFTGGLDKETIETSTADEIRALTAIDYVRPGNKKYFDPNEAEHWVVDFEGVARGFFSSRLSQILSVERESDIKLYCSVVRNFLNYVLAHDVCPEYDNDIKAAQAICNKAEIELWKINQFRWAFPGEFNMAASTLYGGRYKGVHASLQTWEVNDPENEKFSKLNPGMSEDRARAIFKTGVVIGVTANQEIFNMLKDGNVHVLKSYNQHFEVASVSRASEQLKSEYAGLFHEKGGATSMKPLGSMLLRTWTGPLEEEDCTDDEDEVATSFQAEEKTFWVEDEILAHVFVGMKMELKVNELNIGVNYFDTLGGPYCSFYQTLENEKMTDWKEPVPNTRPAPSEDNPNVEEAAFAAEIEGDVKNDEKINLTEQGAGTAEN